MLRPSMPHPVEQSCEHSSATRGFCSKELLRSVTFRFQQGAWRMMNWLAGESLNPNLFAWRGILVLTFIMIGGVAICAQIPGLGFGWHFGEGKPMTLISAFGLLCCGVIASKIAALRGSASADPHSEGARRFWKFLAYGFPFLAFDELFKLHETVDRYLHKLVGIKPVGITDHLDDAIIALYGVVLLVMIGKNLSEVARYRSAIWLFGGAALSGALTIALDFMASAKWLWLMFWGDLVWVQFVIDVLDVIEEFFKLYAEVFFVATLLACFKIAQRKQAVL